MIKSIFHKFVKQTKFFLITLSRFIPLLSIDLGNLANRISLPGRKAASQELPRCEVAIVLSRVRGTRLSQGA
jgi:hypothetical protein